MDIKKIPFDQHTFDIVIDKGTIDCLYVSLKQYNVPKCDQDPFESVTMGLKEIYRVLKPKGTLISISHAPISSRLTCLQNLYFDWEIRTHTIPKVRQMTQNEEEGNDDNDNENNQAKETEGEEKEQGDNEGQEEEENSKVPKKPKQEMLTIIFAVKRGTDEYVPPTPVPEGEEEQEQDPNLEETKQKK